jgi:putative hemolysin
MTARGRFPGDASRYAVTLTREPTLLEDIQRLRYRVFSDELGASLAGPQGRDADEFDPHCDHLVVRDVLTGEPVGTYRILAPEAACRAGGYYAEREFDLTPLQALRPGLAELGRTCVHPEHRSGPVMLLMWSALARLALDRGYLHLIGCASLGLGQGIDAAHAAFRQLAADGLGPEALRVSPRNPLPPPTGAPVAALKTVPPLVRGYLTLGAWVCGEPAWDPEFGCADVPMLLDLNRLDQRFVRHFLARSA